MMFPTQSTRIELLRTPEQRERTQMGNVVAVWERGGDENVVFTVGGETMASTRVGKHLMRQDGYVHGLPGFRYHAQKPFGLSDFLSHINSIFYFPLWLYVESRGDYESVKK